MDMSRKYQDDDNSSINSWTLIHNRIWNRTVIVSAGIAIFGILAGSFFLSYGIASSNSSQERRFRLIANEIATEFELAWEDYVNAAKWLHQACQYHPINRTDFQDIFEHLTYDLDVQVRNHLGSSDSILSLRLLNSILFRLPNGSQKFFTISELPWRLNLGNTTENTIHISPIKGSLVLSLTRTPALAFPCKIELNNHFTTQFTSLSPSNRMKKR